VGLVPVWTSALREYERQGQIVAIPIPKLGLVKLALYFQEGGPSRLAPAAQQFVEAIREDLQHLKRRLRFRRECEPDKFPPEIGEYRWGYYVSCTGGGNSEWRRCTVEWRRSKRGNIIRAVTTDFDVKGQPKYALVGRLDEDLLSWRATEIPGARNRSRPTDRYVVAMTAVTKEPPAVMGTWTGFDDSRTPVSAPFLISTRKLAPQELVDVTELAQLRVFLNAQHVCQSELPLPS